jgi:2,5-diketo-D-gluconate reductase A
MQSIPLIVYFYGSKNPTMKNHNMTRRDFLKKSAIYTALVILIGSAHFSCTFRPLKEVHSIPTVTLNNGLTMPVVGFGTSTLHGDVCIRSVSDAISVGFRLFDTAHIYGNEEFVGEGIKQSGIPREELFITTKLWVDDAGYESTKKAFQTSMDKLGLEYVDLYLIHRPRGDVKGSWKAMEELYQEGKIKAIGVSNFEPHQIEELLSYAEIKPAVNQIENHVFYQQHEAHDFLKNAGVQMQGWSPFAAGRNNIFENPVLAEIGKKHGKSIAQVCLRWHYQRGIVAIPRTSQKEHMIENLDIFDFELDAADMQTIAGLDLNVTQFPEWE